MTKPNNSLNAAMQGRNPLEMRQAIQPVDILQTERNERSVEPNEHMNRTSEPNDVSERVNRSHKPKKRTEIPHGQRERNHRTVFDDLKGGTSEEEKRPTERYSFEIYTDQKGSIEEVQYLYKKKTGKKLSVSRIIREALEEYLSRALEVLRQENQE